MLRDIVVGLITAAVGGLLTVAWQRILHPFFVERFLEPTKIAAEYTGTLDFGRGPSHVISIRIKKLGYRVTGTLRFTKGRHRGKEYTVVGRYWHGLLTFMYWPVDKASTSQGTATFQRKQDGNCFAGEFAYFSQEEDKVATVSCVLTPA